MIFNIFNLIIKGQDYVMFKAKFTSVFLVFTVLS